MAPCSPNSLDDSDLFEAHRPRLRGIAYRMLGTHADADDVLQDAWLRWAHHGRPAELQSAEAWLVTTVSRLCIDRLRGLRHERAEYIGPWLPEPELSPVGNPETMLELAGDLSLALMAVLERLSPDERAAFLLREVFDYDYPEVADTLARSEAACRQLVHRARAAVEAGRPRFCVAPEAHRDLLEGFIRAAGSGDRGAVMQLFAEDARWLADGGGKVQSALRELRGNERIARLLWAIARRTKAPVQYRHAWINGEPGLLSFHDGKLDGTLSFVTDGQRIHAVHVVRNPDKLARIAQSLAGH